jgi:uncharacterized protein YjbI with pentapeptide repeats
MPPSPSASVTIVPFKLPKQSVFLAGNFYGQDAGLKTLIEREGGTIAKELDDKTDFVVLGYSGVANPQKKVVKLNAQGAAIQVLSVEQLRDKLRPTSDEAAQLLRSGPAGVERWNQSVSDHNPFIGVIHGQHGNVSQGKPYFQALDFSKADLRGAILHVLMDHCDLTGANLSGCVLNLSNCQLEGATLDGVQQLSLATCTAKNVAIRRIVARQIHAQKSDLSGSQFDSEFALHVNFDRCQLDDSDFTKLKTRHAVFSGCSLKNANFAGTEALEADFSGSDLSGANFSNANLNLAKLAGAKVDGANFKDADLSGADVANVDFSKALGFDPSQIQGRASVGPAVQEFIDAAANAQRLTTSLVVSKAGSDITLTADINPQWGYFHDTDGVNRRHWSSGQSRGAAAAQWSVLVTKWHGATPDLASVTARGTKSTVTGKALKQLALRAWCELFGVTPPSEEDLKTAAAASKARKKEDAVEWIESLTKGKKGVATWNDSQDVVRRIFDKAADIDLAGAKLNGIVLEGLEWRNAHFAGADLSKAKVSFCKFPEGDFQGAKLVGAMFRSTSFTDANLENLDASAAELWASSLKRAKCAGATFAKANLTSVDLCGADFSKADLEGVVVQHATYDEHTKFPQGFTPTLEMVWKGPGTSPAAHKLVQKTKPKGKLDIDQFMKRLEELTDAAKLKKALSMLKADRFKLYAQVNDDYFVGVVKSQGDPDLVYSCRLNADGTYACCTQNLNVCGGLRGSLCKHLLVLIVGLTKNGELDPNALDTWIRLSQTNKPTLDKDAMSETFLRYKGAEAGEVDWRPTETIPEDYYAM